MGEHAIGIVGLRTIGRFHADHLTALTTEHDISLAGGMDIAPPARDRFEEQFGAPAYETY